MLPQFCQAVLLLLTALPFTAGLPCNNRLLILRGISGVVLSPNYGEGLYEKNDFCRWLIEAPYGKRIQLHFAAFDVEGDRQCGFDFVKVIDGVDGSGKEIGRFCGEFRPADIISSTSNIFITFKTDSTTVRKGFKIQYNVIDTIASISSVDYRVPAPLEDHCGGRTFEVHITTKKEAELTSPNYPSGNYAPGDSCTWMISSERGSVLRISFHDFHLQDSAGCMADFLEVIDGPSDHHPSLARLCGGQLPRMLITTSNIAIVKFATNSFVEDAGFRVTISADSTIGSGSLDTPQQRLKVSNGIEEVYRSSNKRRIDDNGLGLLSVLNNTASEAIATHATRCNGKRISLSGPRGRVNSPNYGIGYYFPNDKCQWLIEVPAPNRIRLVFEEFQLTKPRVDRCVNSDLETDTLSIYDGQTTSSPLLAVLCGTHLPGTIVSQQSSLLLDFTSAAGQTMPGFSAFYTEISADFITLNRSSLCQGSQKLIRDASGYIMSPNYNGGPTATYNANDMCQWLIRAPDDTIPIHLEFEDFDVEESPSCVNDRLAIFSGSGAHAPLSAALCGHGQPPPLTIPGGAAFIRFETDPHVQGRGFKIRFTTVLSEVSCDADLTVMLRNEQIQASSYWRNHFPYLALFTRIAANPDSPCCWSTASAHEPGSFMEFDLGHERRITGFVTRGSPGDNEWVTSYYISTAADTQPPSWQSIKNDNEYDVPVDRIFPGNRDPISTVINHIWPPIKARYVRFLPRSEHVWMTTKFAVLGCV